MAVPRDWRHLRRRIGGVSWPHQAAPNNQEQDAITPGNSPKRDYRAFIVVQSSITMACSGQVAAARLAASINSGVNSVTVT